MLRKCMDVSNMIKEGFKPNKSLEVGIEEVIESYKNRKQ
jgi:GDP-L-fucose synthase